MYLSLSLSLSHTHTISTVYHVYDICVFCFLFLGKWRDYPVNVTAYSYAFGAIFMGLATIYFGASGKKSEFLIPQNVRIVIGCD